jgi:hypothetical protein
VSGPRRAPTVTRLVVAVVCSLSAVACSIGETNYKTVEQPVRKVSEVRTCSGAFAKPDMSTLTACGDGKGHCYGSAKTSLTGLPDCAGGSEACIPDKVLEANGATLKSCKFFIGDKPGVCMSTILKDVAAHQDELKQDACDADERCVPCINPLDGTETHACDATGVYEDDCKGGAAAQQDSCCHGQGVCISPDAVPADSRGDMSPDICSGGQMCAPAALVDGTPEHCTALGLSGVCIDICFARMLGPSAPVLRGGCSPTAVCLPCVVGKSKNVPGCD